MANVARLDDYRQQQMMNNGYTKVPNWINDMGLPMGEAAFLNQIARQTIGWQRQYVELSLAELSKLLGTSKNTILKIRSALIQKKLLFCTDVHGGRCQKTSYWLGAPSDEIAPVGDTEIRKKGSNSEPFSSEKGSNSEPFSSEKGSNSEPFSSEKGSESEHAYIKAKKEKIKEKKTKEREGAANLPESVNFSAWQEFKQHRAELKKPITPTAENKLISLLSRFDKATQQAMVDKSIASGWVGLFELRERSRGAASVSAPAPVSQSSRPVIENI